MRLDPSPHVGDGPLRRDAEHLRQRERRHGLDDGRRAGRECQRHQHVRTALADDIVDQKFGRGGEHEADEAVDQHERQAEREPALAREDQGARFAPRSLG